MPCVNIGCRQQCSMLEIILFFTRVRPYGRSFDILCFRMCPSYAHCRRRLREGWLERQCRRAMKLSLVSMFSNKCLHANHKKLICKDILISSNVSECHYFFSFLFSLIYVFLSCIYQVYKDRNVVAQLVRRAEKAGFKAIALTVDTPRLGRRESDIKNRFGSKISSQIDSWSQTAIL